MTTGPAATDGPPPAGLWGTADSAGPPPAVAEAWRSAGWWRTGTFLDDLYRTAAADGTRTALIADRAHHPADLRLRRLSYAQLATYVDRYAAALRSLGLRAGDPVAYQLPSWWEAAALTLAVWRIGAVAVPVLPVVRAGGLERILAATQARLCVVPDVWEGHAHAEVLDGLAPRLPWLRRRAVLRTTPGGPGRASGHAPAPGTLDFDAYFTRTPHERGPHACPPGLPGARPGDPALLITVMALGERFRAVLHSPDTLYAPLAAARTLPGPVPRPGEVFFSALPFTSLASLAHSLCWPLALGGTAVLQDVWDPNRYLDLLAEAGVNQAYASPAQWAEVLTAHGTRATPEPAAPPALRLLLSGGRTPTPPELLAALPEALGAPVRSLWGAPEVALGTLGGVGDPTEGAPLPGLELDSRDGGELWVRGPAVAHAVWPFGADRAVLPWQQDGGWLATGDRGDAARARVTGRAGHRTGAAFLVPVAELEEALAAHPGVREAAVVEYGDPEHGELPCAVVVPAVEAESPGLVELREWLAGAGLAPAALPTRLELVGSLPRAEDGTLRKDALRAWLSGLRPGEPRTAPK
ncbi:AMP-binding protein [Streptomyces sp. NPDC046866]|uniref:AMP-binding protein n=1 Tax=Streptomyces sp. NPDC046866 TaxID=3154921 RepID=UPI003451DF19